MHYPYEANHGGVVFDAERASAQARERAAKGCARSAAKAVCTACQKTGALLFL